MSSKRRIGFFLLTTFVVTHLVFSQTKSIAKHGPAITVSNGPPPTVAEVLKQHHIALTNEALVEALQNPNAEIRGLAAAQLAVSNARGTIPDIISAVNKETSPLTRANIASALTQLGDETGFSVLKNMCNSADIPGHFRTLAARYLLDVNDGSCLDAVLSILETDGEASSHMAALDILPRFKNVSESDFRKIYALDVQDLTNPTPSVRLIASSTLVALGGDSAVGYLAGAIAAETNEAVRTQMEADLRRLRENAGKSREQATSSSGDDPFSIFIFASKVTVESGEPVSVRVSVTNTSDHEIRVPRVSSAGMDLAYEFEVRGPNGTEETEKTGDKATGKYIQSALDRSLKPGESTPAEENLLSRVYRMTEPGQYKVEVSRRTFEEGNDRKIKSNTITVTVVPKD